MSHSHDNRLSIPLELAETLLFQLRTSAGGTGREPLLETARRLQAEIDAQFSQVPPEH